MEFNFIPSVINEQHSAHSNSNADEILLYDFSNIKLRINFHGYGEMAKFVSDNILSLLSSAVDKKAIPLRIITDKDFLIAMDLSNISLSKDYINRFNRVYRSYVINPAENVIYNDETAMLLYKIAVKLNKKMIEILKGLSLSEKDACWITINRFSSTDERRNIRRMVRAIQHIDPNIMTEQMVVNIFARTFNDQLTNLFCAIMTDKFDSFDSEDEKYVYSTVSNALLDILNTMDIDEIKDIIIKYEDELKKSGISGRFSLSTINSGDYPEICQALDEVIDMGVIIY